MATEWITTGGVYADNETDTEYVTTFGVMAESSGGVPPAPTVGYQMIIQWLVAASATAGSMTDKAMQNYWRS